MDLSAPGHWHRPSEGQKPGELRRSLLEAGTGETQRIGPSHQVLEDTGRKQVAQAE